MAQTLAAKLFAAFYYTWLGGGVVMQIPAVGEILETDRVNSFIYHLILLITFLVWVAKSVLSLYKEKKEIDARHKDKD